MTTIHAVIGVNISVGNAAVQTTDDLCELLHILADSVAERQSIAELEKRSVLIIDYNGNRVGSLQATGYYETEDED